MILELTNPHSVLAALERRPQDVLEVSLSGERLSDAWRQVADTAMESGVAVTESAGPGPRADRSKSGGGRQGRLVARVRPLGSVDPSELFTHVRAPGSSPGLWLALDCVQDPHNLGAVFRSAAFFGVRGVLLTRDRSAPLSAVVYDVASGGMESVPFSSPPNLDRALKVARDAGLWILGAAEEAERDVSEVPRDRPWLLVLGNEESGLRRLTRENCDDVCRITSHGAVGSLNISAAGAVLMAQLSATSQDAPSGESTG
jgi:23S rRNA (guanosine2251-2'-O)-methyltransferase